MNQIYNFEQHTPPPLSENALRKELERRRLHRQAALFAAAGILMQAAVLAVGFSLYSLSPALALGCFLYTLISATGSGVLAVVVTQKGGLKV